MVANGAFDCSGSRDPQHLVSWSTQERVDTLPIFPRFEWELSGTRDEGEGGTLRILKTTFEGFLCIVNGLHEN